MDTLRWILLAIGAVIIAVIYLFGRRARRGVVDEISEADPVAPLPGNDPAAPGPRDMDRELAQLGSLITGNRRAPAERIAPATHKAAAEPAAKAPVQPKTPTAQPAAPVEEKLVVIYIVAPAGGRFAGTDVRRAVEAAGLSHGRMHIFHRLANPDQPDSEAVFSLASMVEPGTFDLDALDDFSTPGLTLFMQLPGPLNGLTALDSLIAAARRIATELNGELRDQTRSVLGKQTIEHLRTDIMEYQRRLRVAHTPS